MKTRKEMDVKAQNLMQELQTQLLPGSEADRTNAELSQALRAQGYPESSILFIVRAVSAHEELLGAAQNARNVLAALAIGDLKRISTDSQALRALRSAINHAEGGK